MSAGLLESAAAVTPPPGADPAAQFHPGDLAQLVVRASWDGEGSIAWPSKDDLERAMQGKVRVLDEGGPAPAGVAELHASGAAAQDGHAWTIQLLLPPGEAELPAIPVKLQRTAGEPESAEIAGATVTVATVLDQQTATELEKAREAAQPDPQQLKAQVAQHLAPARGPWELAPRIPWWAILAAALLLLALAAWAAWRWHRRRGKVAAPAPPPEPAEVVARRRLRALRDGGLLGTGKHLAFHVELADILKEYLERRLGVEMRERTSEEIRRLLHGEIKTARHVPEIRQDVLQILAACDLVKFAKFVPVPSEALAHVELVERLVTRTTEVAPAQPAPPRAPGPQPGGREAA